MQMEYIEVFITALGGTVVTLAIAAYLGRRFIDIQVSHATEKFKAELEQRSAILKTELSIYAHEQNVGISRLDQQRSVAVCAIYGLVSKWHDILMEMTIPNEPKLSAESLAKRYCYLSKSLVDSAEAISKELYRNAILFQDTSYQHIGKFSIEAMELSCEFYDNTFGKSNYPTEESINNVLCLIGKERKLLAEKTMEDFDLTRSQLIQELRLLMKAER
jgi:hypothetical protein